MKFIHRILDGWAALVRSAWRTFAVFSVLGILAIIRLRNDGYFDTMAWSEIGYELAVLFGLLFLAAFVTAIIFHVSLWFDQRSERDWID